MLKLHFIQHVPFEGPAFIETWARRKGHDVTGTLMQKGLKMPRIEELDWIILLGGPMNIYEHDQYPWLVQEKKWIEKAVRNGKTVMGVCLGAQLIADVLGGRVMKNRHKEIGWYPVTLTENAKQSLFFNVLPREFIAFHWHGDTFETPLTCRSMAQSEACSNQAFEYDDRIFGLQFHLESTEESINLLLNHCGDDIKNSAAYVQNDDKIRSGYAFLPEIQTKMESLLNRIELHWTSK